MSTTTVAEAYVPNIEPFQRRPLNPKDLSLAFKDAKTVQYPEAPTSSSKSSSSTSNPSLVKALAWSPLGNYIASADNRALRIWSPERAAHIRFSTELKLPSQSAQATAGRRPPASSSGSLADVVSLAWSPVKDSELASLHVDGTLRFWDVRARQGSMHVGSIELGTKGFSLAWRSAIASADELVASSLDNKLFHVKRSSLNILHEHPFDFRIDGISFSNSGLELLVSAGDASCKILDFPSMKPLHTLRGHTAPCHTVAQCPRGRYVAVGSSDAMASIWDTQDFFCKTALSTVSLGPIRTLSWSWDGVYLIAGGDDGGEGLKIAHAETGEIVHTIPVAARHATPSVAFHPTRYVIAYGGGDNGGLRIVGYANNVL